jgi:hypothetical protein
VTGGAEGEVLHLPDFTPYSDAPSRAVFPAGAVAADRDRLVSQQQPDGGWEATYTSFSPGRCPRVTRLHDGPVGHRAAERRPMTDLPWGPSGDHTPCDRPDSPHVGEQRGCPKTAP